MLILLKASRSVFLLFLFLYAPLNIYSDNAVNNDYENTCTEVNEKRIKKCYLQKDLTYYLNTEEFIESFIEIPTNLATNPSTTISSRYLAGRATVYNTKNKPVGTCSASFLCMKNQNGIFTDISNYLSIDNGLIVTWFTPTTLINLEFDSVLHSMVTECIVIASTKIGFNPFYGKKFNMVVSSKKSKIYFKLTEI